MIRARGHDCRAVLPGAEAEAGVGAGAGTGAGMGPGTNPGTGAGTGAGTFPVRRMGLKPQGAQACHSGFQWPGAGDGAAPVLRVELEPQGVHRVKPKPNLLACHLGFEPVAGDGTVPVEPEPQGVQGGEAEPKLLACDLKGSGEGARPGGDGKHLALHMLPCHSGYS